MTMDAKTQAQLGQAVQETMEHLVQMRAALENIGDALRAAAQMVGEQTRQSLLFRSRLATITSLDLHELIEAGVIGEYGGAGSGQHATDWDALKADPLRWVLKLDDHRLEALWALIEKRHSRSAAPPAPQALSGGDEDTSACPVCGNEERGQGGYLSCECPAPPQPREEAQ